MAIPDDDTLQRELLLFLASEPEARASVWRAYKQLALLHPELTEAEKSERYRNSTSKWANRVQFARLHLANAGLVFKANAAPAAQRNYWALTPKGHERAQAFKLMSPAGAGSQALEQQIAADLDSLTQEESVVEGLLTKRLVAHYERDPRLRAAAVAIHGTTCKACGFNFEAVYGEHGRNYIEVHHIVPVSTFAVPSSVNPQTDLTVLCSNCHRMVHRRREAPLSPRALASLITSRRTMGAK